MTKKFKNKKNFTSNFIKKARKEKGITKTKLSIELELLGIYMSISELHRVEENQLLLKDFELVGIAKILDLNLNKLKDLLD